jgi:hypothetical protein
LFAGEKSPATVGILRTPEGIQPRAEIGLSHPGSIGGSARLL